MSVEKLVANIEKGSRGENVGISTGLPVIDSIIFGIQNIRSLLRKRKKFVIVLCMRSM